MELEAEILREHSKAQAIKIASFIGNDKKRFGALMDLFLNGEYRITQRSAWIVSHCAEKNPDLLKPYLSAMLENLNQPVHDAVKRNTLRVFQFIELPEDLLGIAAEICFNLLNSKKEPVAIKVFAMTIIFNIIKKEPELKNELRLSIEDQMPFASAGFRSRGSKILNAIEKKNNLKFKS